MDRGLFTVGPSPISSRAFFFRHSPLPASVSPRCVNHLTPRPPLPALRSSATPPPSPSRVFSLHCTLSLNQPRQPNFAPRASSSPGPEATPPPPSAKPVLQGAKPLSFAISIGIGLIVRFLIPRPVEVTLQAWQLLAIFLSTVAGLVLSPLPVGAWAFLGLTTSIVTKTLAFSTAFSAFTNEVMAIMDNAMCSSELRYRAFSVCSSFFTEQFFFADLKLSLWD